MECTGIMYIKRLVSDYPANLSLQILFSKTRHCTLNFYSVIIVDFDPHATLQ